MILCDPEHCLAAWRTDDVAVRMTAWWGGRGCSWRAILYALAVCLDPVCAVSPSLDMPFTLHSLLPILTCLTAPARTTPAPRLHAIMKKENIAHHLHNSPCLLTTTTPTSCIRHGGRRDGHLPAYRRRQEGNSGKLHDGSRILPPTCPHTTREAGSGHPRQRDYLPTVRGAGCSYLTTTACRTHTSATTVCLHPACVHLHHAHPSASQHTASCLHCLSLHLHATFPVQWDSCLVASPHSHHRSWTSLSS